MALIQHAARTTPGIGTVIETLEREIVWGSWDINRTYIKGCTIAPAAVDAGNTDHTSILRPGLAMGYNTDTKEAINWTYAADGSNLFGFLLYSENMMGPGGAVTEKWFGYVLVAGQVRVKDLIFGASSTGSDYSYGNLDGDGNETAIRAALAGRFLLDDFHEQFTTTEA